jgi:hypothetical protein
MGVLYLLLIAYIISLIAGPMILIRIQNRMFGESRLAWLPGLILLTAAVVVYAVAHATASGGKGGDVPVIDFSGIGYPASCLLLLVCGVACLVAAGRRYEQPRPPEPVLPVATAVNRYSIVESPPHTVRDDVPKT